eukprot:c48189_g1_i1.p2 GENE.c48189_g1_i1~~c48189_g1_i1.p2  ORF type:complete len:136 (-),score=34.72 c48189_g1_i1:53-430(-)
MADFDEDEAMEAYKQKRMAEMQGDQLQKQQAAQQQRQQQEQMKKSILTQILTPEARERLARIRLVRAEKAEAVELMLIRAAQSGRIGGQVTDEYLVQMLEQLNQSEQKAAPKVTIQRRRNFEDDD